MSSDDDLIEENRRLTIEVEGLRARLIAAKASTRTASREPNWGTIRLGMLLYLREKATEAGFDGSTEAGLDAYRAAEKRRVKAWARAEVAADPSARASILRTLGEAYLEPDEPAKAQLPKSVALGEPAPAFNDPMAAYLPKATPGAILHSLEKAQGKVVDLPVDPVARAIIAADRRAREPDSGSTL